MTDDDPDARDLDARRWPAQARPTGPAPGGARTTAGRGADTRTGVLVGTHPTPAVAAAVDVDDRGDDDEGDADDRGDVVVRRSARRRRSVTAFREGERIVVVIPATLSAREEREWVARMVQRVAAKERRPKRSDLALADRAAELSRRYLGGRAVPSSVRWVTNQHTRWGSCTPLDGTIRVSHHVQSMPDWVLDSVLLHELAHLIEPGHGPRFQALVNTYPQQERARGFLEGAAHAWARQESGTSSAAERGGHAR